MTGPPPLTWLYVPADRPDRIEKALTSAAHALIVDLEDAVAPPAKEAARANLSSLLSAPTGKRVHVRVNALSTPWGHDDVEAVTRLSVDAITFPKVESRSDIAGELPVHCLIESAAGVEAAYDIARDPRVSGIALGEADLRGDTGAGDAGLDWARSRIVNAAVAAGLPRPPQSVYADIRDLEGLAASCERGRELGFFGRAAIHPAQLPVIEQAYLPTEAEVQRARELVEAFEQSTAGAFALGGGFVDVAVVRSARGTVALAALYGTRA
jgi:citrate lyase subunit beta / citryl-CoA lyase